MTTEKLNTQENFSIEFSGPALESHEISASALAQSLLALDALARRCAEAAYGRDADISIKVRGNPRPGSFIVDLVIEHSEKMITIGAGAATILLGVIGLGKWAFGKKVKVMECDERLVLSDNESTMELEITGARFNGSPIGWTFYEGENGREFSARVEDEDFLQAVKDNRIIIKNGTSVLATIRTVQKKTGRLVVERSIVEVIEVRGPEN